MWILFCDGLSDDEFVCSYLCILNFISLSIDFFFCFFGLVLVLVWFGSLPFPYLLVFMMVFFLSRSGSILSIRHIYTRAYYT